MSTARLQKEISGFIHDIGVAVSISTIRSDPSGEIERQCREHMKSWDFGDGYSDIHECFLHTGVDYATMAFGHTPVDVQVHIAEFTLLMLCVDDFVIDKEIVKEFTWRFLSRSPQAHPLLDQLAINLRDTSKYYLPLPATMIVTSAVQFIDSAVLDKETENMPLQPSALLFVEYKRFKNAGPEAYSFFIWDKCSFPDVAAYIQIIPECAAYLNYANDVLSFYKEEMAGERNNFVHDRALVSGKSVRDTFRGVIQDTVECVQRARDIIGDSRVREIFERVVAGYIAWHYFTPRYRLKEILSKI